MKYEEIVADLKAGKYAPIYFLSGEESYFLDDIATRIEKNALTEDEKAFNQTILYGNDVSMTTVTYLEGAEPICTNGLYEAFCIIVAFPVLVWIGASGTTTDKKSTQICKFLGDISYPIYVIHYPFMYLFYAWLIKNQLFTLEQTWQVALCVYAWNILLAYLCLKWYDEPIRKYLAKRFLKKK